MVAGEIALAADEAEAQKANAEDAREDHLDRAAPSARRGSAGNRRLASRIERETVVLGGLERGGRAARDSITPTPVGYVGRRLFFLHWGGDDVSFGMPLLGEQFYCCAMRSRGSEARGCAPRVGDTAETLDASSSRSVPNTFVCKRRRRGEASGPGRWSERKRARVKDASGQPDISSGHALRYRRPRLSGATRWTRCNGDIAVSGGPTRWTLAFHWGSPRSDEVSEVRR